MNVEGKGAPSHGALDPASLDPAPLVVASRNWTRWVGPAISLLILGAVVFQLRSLNFEKLWQLVPTRIDFWLVFVSSYMIAPFADWIIFKRLWDLPLRGFGALLRKLVSNELLLGYLGEVYFYAWARRNASITAAPFGAVKDVTILSALVGNIVTLVLVILCWPFFDILHRNMEGNSIEWSILFVLAMSLVITLFRNRLFSLPGKELWFVSGVHVVRMIVGLIAIAYMWHCLMPDISLSWLLLLSTMRLLVSRLPFLPNKDLAFAALAAFFVGHDNLLPAALALLASLFLAAHLLVGTILGALELFKEGRTAE